MVTKSEVAQLVALIIVLGFGLGAYSLIPDHEISTERYLRLAEELEACPAAKPALVERNADHKLMASEAEFIQKTIDFFVWNDKRLADLQNIRIMRGLAKGPYRKPTCVAVDVVSNK